MTQEQSKKKKTTEDESKVNPELQSKFEEVKQAPLKKQTKTIVLYHHCIGDAFERDVPEGSNYRNGQVVGDGDRLPGDRPLRDTYSYNEPHKRAKYNK